MTWWASCNRSDVVSAIDVLLKDLIMPLMISERRRKSRTISHRFNQCSEKKKPSMNIDHGQC